MNDPNKKWPLASEFVKGAKLLAWSWDDELFDLSRIELNGVANKDFDRAVVSAAENSENQRTQFVQLAQKYGVPVEGLVADGTFGEKWAEVVALCKATTTTAPMFDPAAEELKGAPFDEDLTAKKGNGSTTAAGHIPEGDPVDPTADLHQRVVDLTTAETEKPKVDVVVILGRDSDTSLVAHNVAEYFKARPEVSVLFTQEERLEGRLILRLLYKKIGHEVLERPLVAVVRRSEGKAEAIRVDIAPNKDALDSTFILYMRMEKALREKEASAPVLGSNDVPASHNGESVSFT